MLGFSGEGLMPGILRITWPVVLNPGYTLQSHGDGDRLQSKMLGPNTKD